MNIDLQAILLAGVFASQIVVISFYAPARWRRYYARMLTHYPPEQYPRLYPLPADEIKRKLAIFKATHLTIGYGATAVFVTALLFARSHYWFAICMGESIVVQFTVPLYFIALPMRFRISKASHAMPPPRRRSVELRAWRITDFVSPLWIGLGLSLQTVGLLCSVAIYLYWLNAHTVGPLVLATSTGVALLCVMIFALVSPQGSSRPDPYMSDADTFRVRQRQHRMRFGAGTFWGVFQTYYLLNSAQLIHIDPAYQYAILSVVIQIGALLLVSNEGQRLASRDFSVYRADSGTQTAQ
jgi:hypothetical protein